MGQELTQQTPTSQIKWGINWGSGHFQGEGEFSPRTIITAVIITLFFIGYPRLPEFVDLLRTVVAR
jgi:hypothetical protein